MKRRGFISSALLAGAGLLSSNLALALETTKPQSQTSTLPTRRLGKNLTVTSIGLGVQNMHRRYDTTTTVSPRDDSNTKASV